MGCARSLIVGDRAPFAMIATQPGTSSADLVSRLRAVGDERCHDNANRYYYQKAIPVKDAFILANLPNPEYRRAWIKRVTDHDGTRARKAARTRGWRFAAQSGSMTKMYSQNAASPREPDFGNPIYG
jgi:hypothetical protein